MATHQGPIVIKEIAGITTPNERWQINWIGEPRPLKPHTAQHMVDVFLSPTLPAPRTGQELPRSTDTTRQRMVPLGVGYLPLIHIGATFKDGQHIPLAPNPEIRKCLSVSPSKTRFVPLSETVNRFIPDQPARKAIMHWEFDIGRSGWTHACSANSQILMLADVNNTDPYYVMIPSIEVARFFYCNTSFFARSLFASGWEDLLRREHCDMGQLPHSITVAHTTVLGLSRLQAIHLGLMLAIPRMEQEIKLIYQALQITSSKNVRPTPLTCRFPFDENTEIKAEVVRIKTGTKLQERFFVTRLLQCRRRFPFEQCWVNPQLHPGQGGNCDDEDLPQMNIDRKKGGTSSEGDQSKEPTHFFSNADELEQKGEFDDDGGAPAKGCDSVNIEVDEDRFPGLKKIPTMWTFKDKQKFRSAKGGKKLPKKGTHMSTGAPSGDRPVLPAGIEAAPPSSSRDPLIRILLESVPFLRDMGFQVSELAPYFLAAYAKEPIRAQSWVKIDKVSSTGPQKQAFRSRLMVAIQVELENMHCVVAEIERRSGDNFGLAAFFIDPSVDLEAFMNLVGHAVVRSSGWPAFDSDQHLYDLGDDHNVEGQKGYHRGEIQNGEQMSNKILNCFLTEFTDPATSRCWIRN